MARPLARRSAPAKTRAKSPRETDGRQGAVAPRRGCASFVRFSTFFAGREVGVSQCVVNTRAALFVLPRSSEIAAGPSGARHTAHCTARARARCREQGARAGRCAAGLRRGRRALRYPPSGRLGGHRRRRQRCRPHRRGAPPVRPHRRARENKCGTAHPTLRWAPISRRCTRGTG